ncbi:AT-hook motif nuclear-localized protein 25-like [Canna indica]|uniref:AT-hook motif nuclear-localized protein 25-like n=1 Tax=Canna indica TaxID=4628 RepID=A0AAQ3JST8_9LILI|nr:AT-hook motif nuclear-localized protein 25-like [Canna indica]
MVLTTASFANAMYERLPIEGEEIGTTTSTSLGGGNMGSYHLRSDAFGWGGGVHPPF